MYIYNIQLNLDQLLNKGAFYSFLLRPQMISLYRKSYYKHNSFYTWVNMLIVKAGLDS